MILPFSFQLVAMDGCCFHARVLHCEVPSLHVNGSAENLWAFETRGSGPISSPRAELRRDLEQRLLDVNSKTQHLLADQREDFDARLAQVPSTVVHLG